MPMPMGNRDRLFISVSSCEKWALVIGEREDDDDDEAQRWSRVTLQPQIRMLLRTVFSSTEFWE